MRNYLTIAILGASFACPASGQAQDILPLPAPEVNADSWVLIEIWPEVRQITLSAYFLDYSYDRNKSQCEAAKGVFDREHATQEEELGRSMSSYRLCLSVAKARAEGFIEQD